MKIPLITALLCTVLLLGPFKALAAEDRNETENVIAGVVVEYSTGGELVQIGNANVLVPDKIFIDNGSGVTLAGSHNDLAIGKLVQALVPGASRGSRKAEQFTIYVDQGIDKILATLPEEERKTIRAQLATFAGTGPAIEEDVEKKESAPKQSSGATAIHLENGVWKN